ncbi:tripartite-type tricarboxylate transporter receptor subunit TctC [Geomicrobium halophilum]|uniref:Tripartite-type tricarboxylate transporter receptor subunit TctC n=1 Tax=Geomicrobium halophilum TaxID=549000 RepID=A0A841PWG9_9BACL|nr:tripartite tricarboxylate transporter substrate binding protein [Geomicrobium halophilum]MBB6448663.1 tripartite-type tricarboxylate transporter receptor subunit TctC [Geomicrobium halophilum]
MKGKVLLLASIGLSVFLTGCDAVSSESVEDYPSRDIEILVGHGPGGGTDVFARTVGDLLEEELGVNINIVNMEGAGGATAKNEAGSRPGDGYTLVASSAFAPATAQGNIEGLDDLRPVARMQSDVFTVLANPEVYEDFDEFVEAAENEGVEVGGVGAGDMDEITANLLIEETGLDINYVSFEGAGDMHAAALGGHIDAMMEEPGPAVEYISSGDLIPLIAFNDERLDDFEDIPTTVEKDIDLIDGVERGFVAPADTPDEIVSEIESALQNVYESEEYQQHAEDQYLTYREGWLGSEEYEQKLEEDIERISEVID